MTDDSTLLRRFADERSEEAFAELVRRHLNLVYSAALRATAGDCHLAKDVCQTVFATLARNAGSLCRHPMLIGWLYTTTHYTAAKLVRTERRRRAREQEAHAMQELLSSPTSDTDWDRLRPALDDVMQKLGERDRSAVLLRFFENRPFADVGGRLGLSENAARMRVDRALDKLRGLLVRRGITSTTAALAALLAENAVTAAPAGLAATVSSGAVAGVAAGAGSAVAFWGFMSTPKVLAGITGAAALALSIAVVLEQQTTAALKAEVQSLQILAQTAADLRTENQRLSRLQVPPAELERLRADRVTLEIIKAEIASLRTRLASLRPSIAPRPFPRSVNALPVYDIGQVDEAPRPIRQDNPVYPLPMLFDGSIGEVVVGFTVDANGDVAYAQIDMSSDPAFDDSALAAVKKWKFTPGRKAGQPVTTRMSVPIVFSHRDDKPTSR